METEPRLAAALDSLVEPVTCKDPESPLRWTGKSLRVLARQLQAMGHTISELPHPKGCGILYKPNRWRFSRFATC